MASSIDVVTLSDFESKMSAWDPRGSEHLYALVDMGRYVSPLPCPGFHKYFPAYLEHSKCLHITIWFIIFWSN